MMGRQRKIDTYNETQPKAFVLSFWAVLPPG